MNLNNQRILITGATGGIGSLLAKSLASKGARLILTGRNAEKLHQLQQSLQQQGHTVMTIVSDLTQAKSDEKLLSQIESTLGGLDLVICNAGVLEFTALDQQSDDKVDAIIQTNVTALIKLSRTVLKRFKQNNAGHFVFVGSIFGSLGFPHFATYCASKFAVHGFSQALRRELVDTNIKVTYVAPRGIKTPMNNSNTRAMFEATGSKMDDPQTVVDQIVSAIEKDKQEVFIGQPESFFAWLNGVMPGFVNIGLKKSARIAREYL